MKDTYTEETVNGEWKMTIFKCKMCGESIEVKDNDSVVICDYCKTVQTLPKFGDEIKENLYDAANYFRRNNEFDKAAEIYKKILNIDDTDAEIYWSLVLCRYGIEYIEDSAAKKRIPKMNRAQFTSIFDDDNYKLTLFFSDVYQKSVYETEAAAIGKIQDRILAISQSQEPFDIFISYKETDNIGRRTEDSVLANDLYRKLSSEGFRVFFSARTLEDKSEGDSESYVFAALNSAKVMIVLGTRPEYFQATCVKNEWSRYLQLIESGEEKVFIPIYKYINKYDLPEVFFSHKTMDMSKLDFMDDLIKEIKKTVKQRSLTQEPVTHEVDMVSLLKRAFMFLEDRNFKKADRYLERVLDIEPECARAYLGKLMVSLKVSKVKNLRDCMQTFEENDNYKKAIRFGDEQLKEELIKDIEFINNRNEGIRLESIYTQALEIMNSDISENRYREAAEIFKTIIEYKDSELLAEKCTEKAEAARKDAVLTEAAMKMDKGALLLLKEAIKLLKTVSDWKDAEERIIVCENKIEETEKQLKENIRNCNVGEYIRFGAYVQDNNAEKNKEEIEWLVLEKRKSEVLAVSRYGLDCKRYNDEYEDVTWEKSTLRKWLNNDFFNEAFSDTEQNMISKINNSARLGLRHITKRSNIADDRVFLLSIEDVSRYFGSDAERMCKLTAYAIANGAWKSIGNNGSWWLRSNGECQSCAAYVICDGYIDELGGDVYDDGIAVRPALWINIKA